MEVSFGNHIIQDGEIVDLDMAHKKFNIRLNVKDNHLHTLIVYDLSAPNVRSPLNSPYLHFLEVNIPGSRIDQGDIIVPYMSPAPPKDSGDHVMVVDVYEQIHVTSPILVEKRQSFPLAYFIQGNRMTPIRRLVFRLRSGTKTTPYNGNYSSGDWVQGLTTEDAKYCRCVVEVAGRQPQTCNLEKSWFEYRDGRHCANPYPICHASIKGESGRPECKQHYVIDKMPYSALQGLASLNNIKGDDLVKSLQTWQTQK